MDRTKNRKGGFMWLVANIALGSLMLGIIALFGWFTFTQVKEAIQDKDPEPLVGPSMGLWWFWGLFVGINPPLFITCLVVNIFVTVTLFWAAERKAKSELKSRYPHALF